MRIFTPNSKSCLCTLSTCDCPDDGEILVDTRRTAATYGFPYFDYVLLLDRYRDADVYGIVLPDVPGSFRYTYAAYILYAPRLGLYGDAFMVLHEYWNKKYIEHVAEDIDIRHVALPTQHHAQETDITHALDKLCPKVDKIHLITPPITVVKRLYAKIEECEKTGAKASIDTTTHINQQTFTTTQRLRTWLKKEGLIRD